MKKLLAFLLAIIAIISLTACGQEKSENIVGTWKVDFIEYEGSKFTVEEWNNMEDEDLSSFYIIFKDGGKAYIYEDGYGDLVNWLQSEDSVMIDDEKCSIIDERICFDYYGDKIYLKKTSDSQEIPKENEEDDNDDEDEGLNSEKIATEDTTVKATNANQTDWRQFLKDYEAWVDDYIELVEKYNANPTDMTILSEYTEMATKVTEWADKADEIELELKDTDEALEYSAELLRIAGKLSEISY